MEQLPSGFSNTDSLNNTEISEGNDEVGIIMSSVKDTHYCPYPLCTFSSAWKSSLSMHMKTHTDERPWQCALCNKHFKLKHHLKHHILTHSQHKPFKCHLCDYRSSDTHSLQRHKVNKHRIPSKRRTTSKRLSLPTMVPSRGILASSTSLLNTFLEQGQNFSTVVSASNSVTKLQASSPTTAVSSANASSLPSLGDVLMLQSASSLPTTGGMKIMNVRSVSDSICSSIDQKNSLGSDSAVDFPNEADKSTDIPSVSSPESLFFTLKEEGSHETDGLGLSLRKTPNSQKSFQYTYSGRKSVESLITKSPSLSHHVAGDSSQKSDPPVFDNDLEHSMFESQNDTSIWKCTHCNIIFPDNIMYGLHMGCHSVGNAYRCNICGMKCKDSHDFMFHFTIGKHLS